MALRWKAGVVVMVVVMPCFGDGGDWVEARGKGGVRGVWTILIWCLYEGTGVWVFLVVVLVVLE